MAKVYASVVTLQPDELKVDFALNAEVRTELLLQSVSNETVAFKIKTTAPQRYSVSPTTGLIAPRASVKIGIVLNRHADYPAEDAKLKDKFQIQAMNVDAATAADELPAKWKTVEAAQKENSAEPQYWQTVINCRLNVDKKAGAPNPHAMSPIKVELPNAPSGQSLATAFPAPASIAAATKTAASPAPATGTKSAASIAPVVTKNSMAPTATPAIKPTSPSAPAPVAAAQTSKTLDPSQSSKSSGTTTSGVAPSDKPPKSSSVAAVAGVSGGSSAPLGAPAITGAKRPSIDASKSASAADGGGISVDLQRKLQDYEKLITETVKLTTENERLKTDYKLLLSKNNDMQLKCKALEQQLVEARGRSADGGDEVRQSVKAPLNSAAGKAVRGPDMGDASGGAHIYVWHVILVAILCLIIGRML